AVPQHPGQLGWVDRDHDRARVVCLLYSLLSDQGDGYADRVVCHQAAVQDHHRHNLQRHARSHLAAAVAVAADCPGRVPRFGAHHDRDPDRSCYGCVFYHC
ncbi:hypothetical protein EC988_010395, partial [Linderina pennispora]